MAIRDSSNKPDDQVPDWVRRSRKRTRELAEQRRRFLARKQTKKDKPLHIPVVKHTHNTREEWDKCPMCQELWKDWEKVGKTTNEPPLVTGVKVGSSITTL